VDADQFIQFMQTLEMQDQQFLGQILPIQVPSASMQQSSASTASVNLALLQSFGKFDPKNGIA
jgi:hypothetical protein